MAVRLVTNGGNVIEPAFINVAGSGVIKTGSVVEFTRTGGLGVGPATSSSTSTNIFGIALDYVQGASDVTVKVIPFVPGQLWEIDCVNSASTAQVGLRHVLDDHLFLRNTATDLGSGNAATAVFRAIAMTGLSTGSGKLIGYFRTTEGTYFPSQTTYA